LLGLGGPLGLRGFFSLQCLGCFVGLVGFLCLGRLVAVQFVAFGFLVGLLPGQLLGLQVFQALVVLRLGLLGGLLGLGFTGLGFPELLLLERDLALQRLLAGRLLQRDLGLTLSGRSLRWRWRWA